MIDMGKAQAAIRNIPSAPPSEHGSDSEESDLDSDQTINVHNLNIEVDSDEVEDEVTPITGTTSGALIPSRTGSLIPSRTGSKLNQTRSVITSTTSVTSTNYARSHLPTFVPAEHEPRILPTVGQKIDPTALKRPKKAFRGRAFPSFGNLIKPLHGSIIFPLSPKQEKLYFKVATNAPIDHYDGDLDPIFVDDIKKFMEPVLESFFPSVQNAQRFLCRRKNYYAQDWKAKFPLASNRIDEFNGVKNPDEEIFHYVDSEMDHHLYDGRFTVSSDCLSIRA